MTSAREEAEVAARLAREHGVSEDAVRTVFDALRRGGGIMAQFSHADFGGISQWSSGMTMVGDMFNDSLKAKLNAIAGELSRYLREHPVEHLTRIVLSAIVLAALGMPAHGGPKNSATLLPSDHRMRCATRCFP